MAIDGYFISGYWWLLMAIILVAIILVDIGGYWFVATLALGLTKAKGLQGYGPRGSLRVKSHTPGSVRKCEGVNPHTPKAISTLGDGVPMDSWNFRERFRGSKINGLWRFLYHWKSLGTQMFKMGFHYSFGHLKHKLWPKEKVGNRSDLLSFR